MVDQLRQPGLRITHKVTPEVAAIFVSVAMTMPEPPTFTVARLNDGKVRLWMSKRTHDYVRDVLGRGWHGC